MKLSLIFIGIILLGSTIFFITQQNNAPAVESSQTPIYDIEIVNTYPHDSKALPLSMT